MTDEKEKLFKRRDELVDLALENYWQYLEGMAVLDFMQANLTSEEYHEWMDLREQLDHSIIED